MGAPRDALPATSVSSASARRRTIVSRRRWSARAPTITSRSRAISVRCVNRSRRADRLRARSRKVRRRGSEDAVPFGGAYSERANHSPPRSHCGATRVIPHAGVTVLITGETGTGKELLARAIHYSGRARTRPFVDGELCARPPHAAREPSCLATRKGAFTGAVGMKPHGPPPDSPMAAPFFLDEIGHPARSAASGQAAACARGARQHDALAERARFPSTYALIAARHTLGLAEAVQRGEFRSTTPFYRSQCRSHRAAAAPRCARGV